MSSARTKPDSNAPRARPKPSAAALAAASVAVRREHIGRLLLIGFRLFEQEAVERFSELGFSDLRLSHLPILRNLPQEGIRTSEIAELTGMTKQAVGQLATELEEFGYCERAPDPTDGRAKLLKFTGRGQGLFAEIPQLLLSIEADFEASLGASDMAALKRALKKLAVAAGDKRFG